MSQIEKQKIINKILEEIPNVNIKSHSHNIINLQLEILDKNFGKEEVLKLVRTTPLKNIGWGYLLTVREQMKGLEKCKEFLETQMGKLTDEEYLAILEVQKENHR